MNRKSDKKEKAVVGTCRFCGKESQGSLFDKWVKDTFTDFDKLKQGNIICNDCLFWFDEKSELLKNRMGKDKPQKMRTYSHFIVSGEWTPLSKANKKEMLGFLLGDSFPELAAIADSGQKHIVFRAARNEKGQNAGWVQFEEKAIYVRPQELKTLVEFIEPLLSIFSKKEIEVGDYIGHRILDFGFDEWGKVEKQIKVWRGKAIFNLALFLAQKGDNGESDQAECSDTAGDDLEGNAAGLQDEVQDVNLAAVRRSNKKRSIHKQSGKVRQQSLFETEC